MTAQIVERVRASERIPLIQAAQEHGFWPYFRHLEGPAGPVVQMEGAERVMLGSNNYLGLTGDPRVLEGARAALERYGTALTGSRLLNGTLPIHQELEEELADWMGTDDALVFTTGYQANLGVLSALLQAGDAVICDSANHASILDGVALSGAQLSPFRHARIDRLRSVLRRTAGEGVPALAIVDGVFSMEGGVCDLPAVLDACEEHDVPLVVDEAHGVGVLGARGTGAAEELGVEDRVALRIGTFSKSLASCGGFVAGPADLVEHLRVEARPFLFTAASVPAAVGAALAATRICRSAQGAELLCRLRENASHMTNGLCDLGYRVVPNTTLDGREIVTPIIPIVVGDEVIATCLWKALYDAGLYVNVAAYPAVQRGGALLRASVMATHSREDLDRALALFAEVRDEAEAGVFAGA